MAGRDGHQTGGEENLVAKRGGTGQKAGAWRCTELGGQQGTATR